MSPVETDNLNITNIIFPFYSRSRVEPCRFKLFFASEISCISRQMQMTLYPQMTSPQSERIQASCVTIWGSSDYDVDIETDDWTSYYAVVKKDFGSSFGPPLTMTGMHNSEDQVWSELDRMLGLWARIVESGEPMTEEQDLEIFGGPNGRDKPILRQFFAEMRKYKAKSDDEGKGAE